ncbi:MAG TPA: hypothetical protein VHQ90_09360 [Thermoanaerobaculia bacterium]|nr:hypothetical protein [Thermoanaerobaculia bacterium]
MTVAQLLTCITNGAVDPASVHVVARAVELDALRLPAEQITPVERAWTNPEADLAIHDRWFALGQERRCRFAAIGCGDLMAALEVAYAEVEIGLRRIAWALERAIATGAREIVLTPAVRRGLLGRWRSAGLRWRLRRCDVAGLPPECIFVENLPELNNLTVGDPAEEHLFDLDAFSRRRDAQQRFHVRTRESEVGHREIAVCHQGVDGEVKVLEAVTPLRNDLFGLCRPSRQLVPAKVTDAILRKELVAQLEVTAVPNVLDEARHELLVGRELGGRGRAWTFGRAAGREGEKHCCASETAGQSLHVHGRASIPASSHRTPPDRPDRCGPG